MGVCHHDNAGVSAVVTWSHGQSAYLLTSTALNFRASLLSFLGNIIYDLLAKLKDSSFLSDILYV